jgi:hypothetical protein
MANGSVCTFSRKYIKLCLCSRKIIVVHKLYDTNHEERVNFVHWLLHGVHAGEINPMFILFHEEVWFHFTELLNSQNKTVENCTLIQEVPLHNDKVDVSCAECKYGHCAHSFWDCKLMQICNTPSDTSFRTFIQPSENPCFFQQMSATTHTVSTVLSRVCVWWQNNVASVFIISEKVWSILKDGNNLTLMMN